MKLKWFVPSCAALIWNALVIVLVALGLMATASTAGTHPHPNHRRDPDRIRALEVLDAPDPFQPPAVSTLTLRTAVRRVAGLKADDDEDRDEDDEDRRSSTQFLVRAFWTLRQGGTIVREFTREVEVHAPFTTVTLPKKDGHGKKSFVRVDLSTSFDGRSTGGAPLSGLVSYQAFAEFVRIKEHKGKTKEIELDDSEVLEGTTTIQQPQENPPPVLTVTAPVDGLITSSLAPIVVLGSLTGQAPLSLTINGSAVALSGGAFSQVLPLSEGTNSIVLVGTDGIGRTATQTLTVTRDSVAPQVTVVEPAAGAFLANLRPLIRATFSDPAPSSSIPAGGVVVRLDGADVTAQATVGAAEVTYTPTANLSDGSHSAQVVATDRGGSSSSASVVFYTDAAAPTLTLSPTGGATVGSATPTLEAHYADSGSGVDTASVVITLDGTIATTSFTVGAASATYTPTVGLTPAAHSWTVSVADLAGNRKEVTASFVVPAPDTTAPTVSLTPADGSTVATATITFHAAYTDAGSGVNVAQITADFDGTSVTGQLQVAAGQATYAPSAPVADALHTFAIRVPDNSGNVAVASTSVRVDTAAPLLVLSPLPGRVISTDMPTLVATYTDVGATASGLNLASFEASLDQTTLAFVVGPVQASFTVSNALAPGPHVFRAHILDNAGNSTTAESAFTVPPPTPPAPTNAGFAVGLVIDGSSRAPLPGVQVRVFEQGGVVLTNAAGRYSYPLASGAYRLLVSKSGYAGEIERKISITSDRDTAIQTVALCPGDGKTSFIQAALGGVVTNSSGSIRIDIPPGALSADTTFRITPVCGIDGLPGGLSTGLGAPPYLIEPEVTLLAPVTVTLKNDQHLIPGHPMDAFAFNHTTGCWQASGVGQVSEDGANIVLQTSHFSASASG